MLVSAPVKSPAKVDKAVVVIDRAIVERFGDRDGLIASKDDLLVMLIPGAPRDMMSGTDVSDQKRVVTPRQALDDGASMLVIGRPITGAADPAAAIRDIAATL